MRQAVGSAIGLASAHRPRERAPKREGHRTQLTVPTELWDVASQVADEFGTTPNDVVVRFASEGLKLAWRRAELARLADRRWHAYLDATGEPIGVEYPSEEEAVEAARALRREGVS